MLLQKEEAISRIFTASEIEYATRYVDPMPSFAARFAAKEAFQKVWPRPHAWKDVWVERLYTPQGPFAYAAPTLGYSLLLDAEMNRQGWRAHLSLTHTEHYASAVVVLEKKPESLL